MIQIHELCVCYSSGKQQIPALQNLSLTLAGGKIHTLIGPSGCGKSTLLSALGGLIKPTSGRIEKDGLPLRPQSHCIGLVPQNYGLFAWQTVEENILLACRIRKKPYSPSLLQYLLEAMKLTDVLQRYPHELSGGQRQRAAIARAFLLQPELLLMDEPFSALDALTREELQRLFLALWEAHPATTLFVTHSIEEAIYLGQTILVMSALPRQTLHEIENPCFKQNSSTTPQAVWEISRKLRRLLQEESP